MDDGWRTQGAYEKYMKTVEMVSPGRKEILSLIARMATSSESVRPKILDIGCGWGVVTNEVLKYSPQASVLMMDFSEEMVMISKERFKNNPNIKVSRQDLNEGLGLNADKEFDAVVSCFAIHHIDFENRVRLYTDIRKALKDSGVFANGDLFKGDSPTVHQWEFDNYIWWMMDQLKKELGQKYTFSELREKQLENYKIMLDKPGTIWDMYHDLRSAGFKYVDCLCKFQNLAVLVAANR